MENTIKKKKSLNSCFTSIYHLYIYFAGKGPYNLHPSLSHLLLTEDIWVTLSVDDRSLLANNLMEEDVLNVISDESDHDTTLEVSKFEWVIL